MKKTVLVIFGTRPEAIKLAPLIKELSRSPHFNVKVCSSAQHIELLNQMLTFFKINVDYDLNIMTKNQSLFAINATCLTKLEAVITEEKPDLIVVQGDTSTAFSGAMAGFYAKIPVAHIEAGLRTYDNNNPFPEEMNRKLISQIATFHFAPNRVNKTYLENEGVKNKIWIVGNTGIDALFLTKKYIENGFKPSIDLTIDPAKNNLLVTGHRRENIGPPFTQLCDQLIKLAQRDDINIIFPLHLNPKLKQIAQKKLAQQPNIILVEPLPYPEFVWIMQQVDLIITDSGGVQEEAPYFKVPVLVTRKITERTELLNKNSKLINLEETSLVTEVLNVLNKKELHIKHNQEYPYGDGHTSKKILDILQQHL